ncbi:hypothetical protein SDC9_150288 [bioreactor metagenome]|uniref:Uncharacterized protein n=1 Tax=bioreactor metagenome TaxID=1076179 RepID=A0A645EM22_9ZZZZ
MPRVAADRFDTRDVKILRVDDRVHQAFVEQIHRRGADAPDDPAQLDPVLDQERFQVAVGRQARPAGACLEGEAVLEPGRRLDHLRAVFGHQQVSGVRAESGGGAGDLLGVADLVHNHHIVHVAGLNGRREVREIHQAVGDHHHLVGVAGVDF